MRNFRKKLTPILIIVFLVIAVPFSVKLVQKRQEIRSRAEGTPPATPKIAGLVLPSVQGFQSDAFTGSSNVSYPLLFPSGLGGQKPNLALSYSSGSVDDIHVGTDNWPVKYPAQASFVGLGWNLGGIDNITAGGDGRFFATVGGASYELINEYYDPYDGHPTSPNWHTNPESYIKIEHLIAGGYGFNNLNPWTITTKDGTKYTFGSTKDETYNNFPEIATAYEIQDKTDPAHPGTGTSAKVGYKWMVKKIEDTHGNTTSFQYQTEIGTDIRGVSDGSGCQGNYSPPENHQYVRFIRPVSISWNNNHYTAEFGYEDRTDKNIDNPNPSCNNPQKHFTDKRLKEILVKIDEQLLRKYTFEYQYAAAPSLQGPSHSLLTKIAQFGTDGATSIPPYTFSYLYPDVDFSSITVKSGNAAYIQIADNGYNGKVTYEYRWGSIWICNQSNQCTPAPNSTNRVRVAKKTVEDGMGNNITSSISYSDDGGSSEGGLAFGDLIYPPSAVTPTPGFSPGLKNYEFLGHGWAKETLSEKNSPGQIVSVTKSYFHQRDSVTQGANTLYFPDPRKGRAHTTEVLDPQNEAVVLSKNQNWHDYNPKPTFNPVDGKMDRNFHPFMALYGTDNYLYDSGNEKHTRTSFGYDIYGNQNVISDDGDVDKQGDERRSETAYIYNTQKWIVNKPLITRQFKKLPGQANFTEFAHAGYYYDMLGWNTPPVKGDITSVDKVSLSPEIHILTHTKYDSFGNPIEITDARGSTTKTEYDHTFRLFPIKVTNPLGQFTTTDYNFLLGVPTRVVDVNGVETRFEYDTLGRAKKIIKTGDDSTKPSVEYIFKDNDASSKAPMVVGTKTRIETGTNQIMETYQFYNGLGQVIQEQSYGPQEGQILISDTVYNSRGAIYEKAVPYFVPNDQTPNPQMGIYQIPNVGRPKTTTNYDALGRVIRITNIDGTFSTTSYNGFTKTAVNEAGVKKYFENDAFGSLLKVQEFNTPGASVPVYATTTYEYDLSLGALTKVTDTKGNITTINYDNFGRKTDMNDPDLGHWRYSYDINSNITEQTDNKNQKIRFEYDPLNRLTKKLYPDQTGVNYYYDEGNFSKGKRTRMVDPSGSTQTEYDNRGRITKETKIITVNGQSNTFITQYSYDNLDRVKTITYPDNEQVQYSYNRAGQPQGLSIVGGQQIVINTTYNSLGQVEKQDYGNNTSTVYSYNNSLRLRSIKTSNPTSPLFWKTYSYDPVGNITSIADQINTAETENFT